MFVDQANQEQQENQVILAVERDGVMHIDRGSLPIVPAGDLLAEHEVYIDVVNRGTGPFRALTGQTAGSGNGYVAELDVDAGVWDILLREDGEARLVIEEHADDVTYVVSPEPGSGANPSGF